MIYDKARQICFSIMQNDSASSGPFIQPIPVTERHMDDEKEFFENLIDKWLLTTQVIKFSAKKLAECLSFHDSYSIILSILHSDQSIYQVSEEKFISKRNLKNYCIQLVYQIKEDAITICDLFRTESELSDLISSQHKKSVVLLVLEELKANKMYDIIVFQNLGFFFPSSRFNPIPKDVGYSILNAKNVLYLSKISNSIESQFCSICENFLSSVKKDCIDLELCQAVNEIRPCTQSLIYSRSSVSFSPPPPSSNSYIQFPFSKSSSDLKDYQISFKDADVYIDDFKSLHGKSWLNDRIIHIYGRIIQDDYEDIFFIPPCTVQYFRFKNGKEVLSVVSSWHLSNYKVVFIPFTNSESSRDPGNHWSLLAFFPKEGKEGNRFYLCDSYQKFSSASLKSARQIVLKLVSLLKLKCYKLFKKEVPQQTNNYDCGIYLLAYMEFLAKNRSFSGMEDYVTPEKVASMRSTIERKILNVGK